MLPVALILSLPFLGCTAETAPTEEPCACERVTYIEAKYQNQTTEKWLLGYNETARESVNCQTETDYSIPPTGSVLREVHRIECN